MKNLDFMFVDFLRNKYTLILLKVFVASRLSFLKSLGERWYRWLDPNNSTLQNNGGEIKQKKPKYIQHTFSNGLTWALNLNDHIDYNFFFREGWDFTLIEISQKILQYKKKTGQDFFCVDIGTHVGTWSIPMATHSDFVISFEPSYENFGRLLQNLELNKIKNVFPFRTAVLAGKSNISKLYFNRTGNSGKSSLFKDWSFSNTCVEQVLGVEVTAILENLPSIGIIKIDTEGFEIDICSSLMSVFSFHRPVVIFEWRSDYYRNIMSDSEFHEKSKDLIQSFSENQYVLISYNRDTGKIQDFNYLNKYENVYGVFAEEVDLFVESVCRV